MESTSTTAQGQVRLTLEQQVEQCLYSGARAALVGRDRTGFGVRGVFMGESVLRISEDLLDHLDAYPHSNEWLEALRSYCDGRLAARREARATGGVVMPRPGGWNIVHVHTKPLTMGRA